MGERQPIRQLLTQSTAAVARALCTVAGLFSSRALKASPEIGNRPTNSARLWLLSSLLLTIVLLSPTPAVSNEEVATRELTISTSTVNFTGTPVEALTVNGSVPGPTLHFREGQIARIHVHNDLDIPSSVHWHGLLLPADMDGVPYVSFPGIAPHSTFIYEFPLKQAGTYWYHSHSGLQEQRGVYGAIVIHPRNGAPTPPTDADHVLVLSDWTNANPDRVLGLLKSGNDYYSIRRGTNQHVWGAIRRGRLTDFLRREWRSMPDNEISDVAYDRFLINGRPESWIPANPGDRIRLRLVNAGASTYFYVQFAGGPMTVVAADGLDVEPFVTDRLLISIAETYDVIVRVPQNGTFEFRATAMDGSGSTSAFIDAGDQRFAAPDVPKPDYYQNTTNAGFLRAMWQTAWAVRGRTTVGGERANPNTPGMHMEMAPPAPGRPATPYAELVSPESTVIAGTRPVREVVLHLTGDMERYVWSMNGKTLSEQHEIPIKKGEVVRFVMINRTMMHHPMHLHGHFFRVLNGRGDRSPLKHTVDVAPMATTVIEFKANAEKDWFFHCHLLYHLVGGMARVVHYEGTEVDAATAAVRPELYDDPWYAFGEVSVLSQMSYGSAQISNTRNLVSVEWEGNWEGEYDAFGGYTRYINRYLSLFGGVNAYDEGAGEDDVRGVFGLSLLLPLNIRSSVWGGTDGSLRWTARKELQLTRRLAAFGEGQYDTVTDWEWIAGGEFVLNKHLSVVGQYHSDYGAGAGLRARFWSGGF
jgi:FtsP/CotA-like multicopper oxidase with cupredoxin domain